MRTATVILVLCALFAAAWHLGIPKGSSPAVAKVVRTAPAPAGVTKSNVFVGAKVDRPVVPAGSEENVVIRVGLFCQALPSSDGRPPVNVAVVLDKSGSMGAEGKIENAKRGAVEVIKRLRAGDTFSLVVYDHAPRVLVPAQSATNRDAIIEAISSICANGSTALYGGVSLGAAEVRKNMAQCADNRIILLSDGLANVGPSSTAEVAGLGKSLGREGIVVTTVGVGLDYNEDLMTALADVSSGNSYFAKNSSELVKIFVEEIGDTLNLAAKNVQVGITCGSGVRPLSFLGRSGRITGGAAEVSIGSLYRDKEKYALLEVQVPGGADGERKVIARVDVTFTEPATRKTVRTSQEVMIAYDSDNAVAEKARDKSVLKDLYLTRTSVAKSQAIKLADEGKHGEAAKVLSSNAVQLEAFSALCGKDREIDEEARRCRRHQDSVENSKGMDRGTRKRIMNESYVQSNQQSFESR